MGAGTEGHTKRRRTTVGGRLDDNRCSPWDRLPAGANPTPNRSQNDAFGVTR